MVNRKESNVNLKHKALILIGIVFSGSSWYLSNGLTGNYWYLLWVAPVPIIFISLKSNGKQAFFISFIAYLIGRLSWFNYLAEVATIVPAIVFTLALSIIFALIIVLSRKIIVKSNSWFSVFAFPVFYTTFEFILIQFSPDGSATSIAYSQSNVLPIIQIASVTGILGITFLLTFVPSAIVHLVLFWNQKKNLKYISGITGVILFSVLLFGYHRIHNYSNKNSIKAGLVALQEKYHQISENPDFLKDTLVAQLYSDEITKLAEKGAKIVVLPERAININDETEQIIIGILSKSAIKNKIYIILGYTNYRNKSVFNSSLVISANGKVLTDYNKIHLVTGLESMFTPGKKIALFNFDGIESGTAICKDLDFTGYIRKYGKSNLSILAIPAWDFEIDDWLHARMSILRGVENGFSEIRAARQGRLTISNYLGRVEYEASCSKGQTAMLIGEVSIEKTITIYSKVGEWLGIVIVIALLFYIFILVRKK